MKKCIILVLMAAMSLTAFAQHKAVDVKGHITDTLLAGLTNATAVLLNETDSVIANFAISNTDGFFELKKVAPGDYILQLSYIGFVPYSDVLTLDGSQDKVDLGSISLEPATNALGEVVVSGERIPMQINKDTIIYNADAFKTQPNDVVEDLLKKLPGIEVEEDGTVVAQGEEVQQVLVDGKEFFGKDTKIATKNLPANAVDKVEVFDRKSDMAEFTGIDDGQEEKAINIELKEDHKNGLFGNVMAGYGTDQRFSTKATINKFTENTQISFLGMGNNVNQQGFSFDEFIGFSGGLSNVMGGGRFRMSGNTTANGVPISNGLSNGNVNTGAGGLNFNHDFSKNTELSLSYFYSGIDNGIERYVTRESVQSESRYLSEEDELQNTNTIGHRVTTTFDHKFDSTQNVRIRGNISLGGAEMFVQNSTSVQNSLGLQQNSGTIDNMGESESMSFDINGIYRKKFAKKGRNMTANFSLGKDNDGQDVLLYSLNQFAETRMTPAVEELINQDQTQDNDQIDYGVSLTYTEPLGRGNFLNLGYDRKNYSSQLLKDVYDLQEFGAPIYNNLLSNHYNRDYVYDRGETSWRWIKGKSNLEIGADLQRSRLEGQFLIGDAEDIVKSYLNLLPKASWQFDLANSKNLRVSYQTSVREPSLNQLQPIIDNSNPLKIYVGNPDLRPEYTHRFRTRYFSFSQFSMTNFFAMANITYTQNAIVNSKVIDAQFRETTTPVNVRNDYRFNAFTGFGTPFRFIGSRFNLHANYTYNFGRVFINMEEEMTNRQNTSLDFSFDNLKKDVLDLRVGTRLGYSITEYSVSKNLNQDYINQSYYVNVNVSLNDSWNIGTKFRYGVYNTFGTKEEIPLWEATLSKYIIKGRGEIRLSAFDILNRNLAIQQNIDINFIENVRTNTLSQYYMASFIYSLNKFGAKETKSGGHRMHIMRH